MGRLLGYARVSTANQDAQLHLDALTKAGYYRNFTDTAAGDLESRPELDRLLGRIRPRRCSGGLTPGPPRSIHPSPIEHIDAFQERGIDFNSLQENIDTSSSGGRLVFNIFASLAEFERDLIRERTNAGLQATSTRGRTGGRPAYLSLDKLRTAKRLYEQLVQGVIAAQYRGKLRFKS